MGTSGEHDGRHDAGTGMKEARFWEPLSDGLVQCRLCPKLCRIAEGRHGVCLGRVNSGGKLYARSYGILVSAAMDPIEKKPLYHFHPGASILSVATYGCNLACPFCQNYEISKREIPGQRVEPRDLVKLAQREHSMGIAYTYTEPLVWFEYLMDICPLVHEAGLKNVLVTNGMLNEAPLRELLPYIDAMNIDLKSIRPEYYRDFLGGDLETVKRTIALSCARCHVEITNLVVPGKNDSDSDLRDLADFVATCGRSTVLHFSRYFPHYRLDAPPTPEATLERAYRIARERLDYVYVGNVVGRPEETNSYCPACGNLLVERAYFSGIVKGITEGKCAKCGRKVDFVTQT